MGQARFRAVMMAVAMWGAMLPAAAQTTSLSISTATLPAGASGAAYSVTLTAVGGTLPYKWAVSGALPAGLTLDPDKGTLSGTPAATGNFPLTFQVTDSAQVSATKALTLVVNPGPLTIATTSPLFNGTVQSPYSQVFSATGGVPPYRWSIVSGSTGDLTLNGTSGVLQGTPQTAATLSFTIQVADSAGTTSAKPFSITISAPALTILTGSPLPGGTVGTPYSQQFTALGGTPPYSWSLLSGFVPGLAFNSTTGVLANTPTAPGTYTLTIQARDSTGVTGTKAFNISINAAALKISTSNQLNSATVGSTFSQTMTATGGVPPYTWAANGLPGGLTIDPASGVISGTATAAGDFSFTVRVTDSAVATWVDLFRMTVVLPNLPSVQITGMPGTVGPAEQHTVGVSLNSPFTADLTGQLILSFAPDSGGGDSTIQFSTGGTTVNFTIPAGSTNAVFPASSLALQTGTVAGSLILTVRLQASGGDVTPSPAPSVTSTIARAAPVITSATVSRSSGTLEIQITGYTTAREVTQATFTFAAASGQTLQTNQVVVPLTDLFNKWFQDASSNRYGSQFTYKQPFTITGDVNAVIPQSVVLTNRVGSSQTVTISR